MKNLLILIVLSTILAGCNYIRPHKLPIDQGNIISEHTVSRLKMGMSETQVREVMGNPVLVNVFTPNRLDYVYSLYNGYEVVKREKLVCLFSNGRLSQIIRG